MENKSSSKINYKDSKLCFDGVELTQVLESFETPLYLYSENELTQNYLEFENAAKNAGLDFQICFALKSNPNLKFVKILADLGSGGDIVSGGELRRALEAGISADKIVFSGVGKTQKEIIEAIDAGIYSFNVESVEELEMINQCAKDKGAHARVAFRLNPKVKALTHKYISTGFKTHKFGLLESDIIEASKEPKYWSHTTLVGLSVHIGSQLTELGATGLAVKALSECAKKLEHKLEFLDVGGGIGVNYEHTNPKAPSLDDYMVSIKENLDPGYPVKVIFEPGRRIAASAGIFVSKVIRSKVSEEHRFMIVDGGMNDFARPSLYEAYHEIFPSRNDTDFHSTDIVGPICETADCFGEKRMMPELKAGEFIAIADTGAYGFSMSSNYNMREKPSEILLDKESKLHRI